MESQLASLPLKAPMGHLQLPIQLPQAPTKERQDQGWQKDPQIPRYKTNKEGQQAKA